MEIKETPTAPRTERAGLGESRPANYIRPGSKTFRVAKAFAKGEVHHRFSAARQLHDTCLHTTVATLASRFGLIFERETIEVPGYEGSWTRVTKYRLDLAERSRLWEIIESSRRFYAKDQQGS